jgi:hypothetical protein
MSLVLEAGRRRSVTARPSKTVAGRSSEYEQYFFQVFPSVLTRLVNSLPPASSAARREGSQPETGEESGLEADRYPCCPAFLLSILEFVGARVGVPRPVVGRALP